MARFGRVAPHNTLAQIIVFVHVSLEMYVRYNDIVYNKKQILFTVVTNVIKARLTSVYVSNSALHSSVLDG